MVKKLSRKKIIIICAIIVSVTVLICIYFIFRNNYSSLNDKVHVEKVTVITGQGSLGYDAKYAGIVEPQKETKIKKDESKSISKVYVSEGDTVKAGDLLFEYDMNDMNLQLEQLNIDLEGINNKITTLTTQLDELNKSKNSASSADQVTLTLQIQSTQLDIKTEQYNAASKQKEIDKLQNSISNSTVKSEIDGIIKSVANTSSGSSDSYITILSTGNYRIKATATELNISELSKDEEMIIYSRVDDSTWSGKISSIDKESTSVSGSAIQNYYDGATTSGSTTGAASKYTFYVEVENSDGLILGQHVYVMHKVGRQNEGISLPSYYIVTGSSSYVWADDGTGKLIKKNIILGEYDSITDTYTVISGITSDDKLAYPSDSLYEGMPTTDEMIYSMSSEEKKPVSENDNNSAFTDNGSTVIEVSSEGGS
jgi:HlyD family secretion protein